MFKIEDILKATQGRLISARDDPQVKGISTDSRTVAQGEAFLALEGENFDGHAFIDDAIKKGVRCVICRAHGLAKRKAIRLRNACFIEVRDTAAALGDIARFQRRKFDIPVIAVTGSNGKTTVKEMIAHLLSGKFKVLKNEGTKNNHIGLPQTLLNLNGSHDVAVLELGTNHFGEIAYLAQICRPNIGVITNIGPSHLEFLKDLDGVLTEKFSLIECLREPAIAVLNGDDALLRTKARGACHKAFILGVGAGGHNDFSFSRVSALSGKLRFAVNRKNWLTLNTLGDYNIYNAVMAVTVARILGMGYSDIQHRFATFSFLENRLKMVTLKSIRFINDTYNSNPLSLRVALETLESFRTKGRRIFVMGDMLELGQAQELFHRQAGRHAAGVCDAFVAVGKLSRFAAEEARESGFDKANLFACENSRQARDILFKKISPQKEDIVLVKGSRAMKMEQVLK